MSDILKILNLVPSAQSIDYVENKKQYHLFSLLTERRHPNTWNLSSSIQGDTEDGLRMLLSVDLDIGRKIAELSGDLSDLEAAVSAVVGAVETGHKIYFYGCGATGRLAKQMESAFWRPLWRKMKGMPVWDKLRPHLPDDIEERLIGEMTGADRALVSSLEAFEDLPLIGRLQLRDRGIERGDIVFCVTEGGETSSVIGTILAALDQWGTLNEKRQEEARRHLYFIYNNPDELLLPFARSAEVLRNPAITRVNLTTGPQAIAGSTRLQATTIETFVLGAVLEEAIYRILRPHLSTSELRATGFRPDADLRDRLASFDRIKAAVDAAIPDMARLTALEMQTYAGRRFATYFANAALITVFIDNTERSPTFRLHPLDRVDETERRCWTQVWTEAGGRSEAWRSFLGRAFRGLDPSFYRTPLETEVTDPYLRSGALRSLANAGNDQELLYDFSFSSSNVDRSGPAKGDLGVAVLIGAELQSLRRPDCDARRFLKLLRERGGRIALLAAGPTDADFDPEEALTVRVVLDTEEDPLTLRAQIALKMLLNAHSTGVMAGLGRVIGNTMTSVNPSNLKLVGRATFLIMTHVNDTLRQPEWVQRYGKTEPIAFGEANAILFDAMDYVRRHDSGQTAEVALSIVRIVEALARRAAVSWEEARTIVEAEGFNAYMLRRNPALLRNPKAGTPRHVD